MGDKEIILNLLEAIEGTLEYQNKEYGNRYYRIFPTDSRYKNWIDTPEGVLYVIFEKLEQEKVIEFPFCPIDNDAACKLVSEREKESKSESSLEGVVNREFYLDLISYHFIKLEKFDEYLNNLRSELQKDGSSSVNSNLSFAANTTKTNTAIPKDSVLSEFKNSLDSEGKAKSTVINYAKEAKILLDYFTLNNLDSGSLKPKDISAYLSGQKSSRNLEKNSFGKLINILKVFLRFLYKREFIDIDLSLELKAPKKAKKNKESLSEPEIEKINDYLFNRKKNCNYENIRDKIIFDLGVKCGLRKSEIINLNWDNIDLENKIINVVNSKEGKDRKISFSDDFKNNLIKYRKSIDRYEGAVVRGNFGKRITSSSMQSIVSKIYKNSGVYRQGLTIHSLRHTFADLLRKKGIDFKVIKELMGHSSLETTDGYFHVSKQDIKDAVL